MCVDDAGKVAQLLGSHSWWGAEHLKQRGTDALEMWTPPLLRESLEPRDT